MNESHPMKMLFDQLTSLRPYPAGVVAMPEMLPGIAFFPGGAGLWDVSPGSVWPPVPEGGVMVLGHNFGSTVYYAKCRTKWRGDWLKSPTWRNLRPMLNLAGIRLNQCLFTNAYVGLRNDGKETGLFPGANDQRFKNECQELFQIQVNIQKPRLILTLGQYIPDFISQTSDQLAPWEQYNGDFGLLDSSPSRPVADNVEFNMIPDFRTVVVALVHPSMRAANASKRVYNGQTGYDVEIDMVRDAMSLAGL